MPVWSSRCTKLGFWEQVVDWQYTQAFRLKLDKVGSTDRIQGRGLK